MVRLMLLALLLLPMAAWAEVEPNEKGECPRHYAWMPDDDAQGGVCQHLSTLVQAFKISIGNTVVWEDELKVGDKCKVKQLPQDFQTIQNPSSHHIQLKMCNLFQLWETAINIELVEDKNGKAAIELPSDVGGYIVVPPSQYGKPYTVSFDKPDVAIPFYKYGQGKTNRPSPKPISTNVYEVYVTLRKRE